jgi:serine/threonine-protein kinase SRPK3
MANNLEDIKPDNIFVKFRDPSLIESGYLVEAPIPGQDRAEDTYTPIQSIPLRQYYFTEDDSRHVDQFDIALGDWGVSSWATKHLTENIQPVALRAPEVLIKAPWDATVDWWNLGALLLELYPAVRMFSGRVPPDGYYEPRSWTYSGHFRRSF